MEIALFDHITPFDKNGPYASIARTIESAEMRESKGGFPYMVGHCKHMDCRVSVHYRKRNLKTFRKPGFVVHWPFGEHKSQDRAVFSSFSDVELLLRPQSDDRRWLDYLKDEMKEPLKNTLLFALGADTHVYDLAEADLLHRFSRLIDPENVSYHPHRYLIPVNQRNHLNLLLKKAFGIDCDLDDNIASSFGAELLETLQSPTNTSSVHR